MSLRIRADTEKAKQLSSTVSPTTNRRGALLRIGSAGLAILSAVRSGIAQRRLALGLDKVEKLKTPGGAALLKIQGRKLLFIRDSKESVHVLDSTCTHKQCTVEYNREKQRIICPCHGSNFSVDGKVLKGPSKKPLQAFKAMLDSDNNRIIFSME